MQSKKIYFLIFFIFSLSLFGQEKDDSNSNSINEDVPFIEDTELDYIIDEDGEYTESTDAFQAKEVTIDIENHPGNNLYQENCNICHNGTVTKAPAQNWLELMLPSNILRAMNDGIMQLQSSHLSEEEKILIAEYLYRQTRSQFPKEAKVNMCSDSKQDFNLKEAPEPYNWGYDNSRFIPKSVGGLDSKNIKNLKLKWVFGFPYSQRARSQPLFALGSIFVGSQSGDVYSLDLETGCVKWKFTASAEIRTAIVMDLWEVGVEPNFKPYIYFGDILAHTYALDAQTGKLVWKIKSDDHPNATQTASPSRFEDKLFIPISSLEVTSASDENYECCTFRGGVLAVEARTGKTLWKSFTIPLPGKYMGRTSVGTRMYGPSGAPIWNSPTIDKKRRYMYVGTGENYSSPADDSSDAIIAYDIDSGDEVWRRQTLPGDAWNVACMFKDNPNCPVENGPDLDYSASSVLIETNKGDILVSGQKSGNAFGINPDTGEIIWETNISGGGTQGGIHFGMSAEDNIIYAPINDMANTRDGKIYLDLKPGMHALDAETGKILWSKINPNTCGTIEFCDPGISAASTAIPGAVIAGHSDGVIRVYNKDDGEIIWTFNALKEFKSISGVPANGGGFGGPGPAIRNGYMAVNSGYGIYYHMPGNALLLFSNE